MIDCSQQRPSVACAAWIALAACFFAAPAAAQPATPVESGREAFDSSSWPRHWYDSDSDGVRAINLRAPPKEPSGESYDLDWLAYFFYGLLAFIALAIVAFLLYAFLNAENRRVDNTPQTERPKLDLARVEELPFDLDLNADDLLGEARRLREQGDLRQAIIYLFSYQLLELDRRQVIRLARGKTNRQYLREIAAGRDRLRQLVELSIVTFEDAFFGARAPSPRRFDDCWSALAEFDRLAGEAHA